MGDGFSHIESVLGVGSTADSVAIVPSAPMPMVKVEMPPMSEEGLAKDLTHDYETARKNLRELVEAGKKNSLLRT